MLPDDDEPEIILILTGFNPNIRDDLDRIARLVAAMLDTGCAGEEITRRLHGWRPSRNASSWPPPEAPL